jgi:hypothetical protein
MASSENIRTIHGPDGDIDIWENDTYGFAAYNGDEKVGGFSKDYDYVIEKADEAAGRDPNNRGKGE